MHDYGDSIPAKPLVLVISHVPPIRSLLAEVLPLDGYSVQLAIDAEQGLHMLQQTAENSIVILQLDPYEDMWELMKTLHENVQLRAHHRIIQMDILYYVEKGRPLEPDDVLVMPFTGSQLFDVMERNDAILRHSKPPMTN